MTTTTTNNANANGEITMTTTTNNANGETIMSTTTIANGGYGTIGFDTNAFNFSAMPKKHRNTAATMAYHMEQLEAATTNEAIINSTQQIGMAGSSLSKTIRLPKGTKDIMIAAMDLIIAKTDGLDDEKIDTAINWLCGKWGAIANMPARTNKGTDILLELFDDRYTNYYGEEDMEDAFINADDFDGSEELTQEEIAEHLFPTAAKSHGLNLRQDNTEWRGMQRVIAAATESFDEDAENFMSLYDEMGDEAGGFGGFTTRLSGEEEAIMDHAIDTIGDIKTILCLLMFWGYDIEQTIYWDGAIPTRNGLDGWMMPDGFIADDYVLVGGNDQQGLNVGDLMGDGTDYVYKTLSDCYAAANNAKNGTGCNNNAADLIADAVLRADKNLTVMEIADKLWNAGSYILLDGQLFETTSTYQR